MPNQEPEYRNSLRETAAHLDRVADRLHHFHLTLEGEAVQAVTTNEWTPMTGMLGVETRLVQGVFMIDVRAAEGAEKCGVQFAEAVTIAPIEGAIQVRKDNCEQEFTTYEPGSIVRFTPGEAHSWKLIGPYRGRAVFVPAEAYLMSR